jgi:hypothetical protein
MEGIIDHSIDQSRVEEGRTESRREEIKETMQTRRREMVDEKKSDLSKFSVDQSQTNM